MAGKHIHISGIQFLFMLIVCSNCRSQPGNAINSIQVDRIAAVAGQFYPGNRDILSDTLTDLFERASIKRTNKPVLAILVPHAGYVFSGDIAASAYNQIEKKTYKNIFVIGSSHKVQFDGASIYSTGNFITPLGTVMVDMELCRKLIAENSCFVNYPEAHSAEHTIEVQLPFLQYLLGTNLKLVPIVIGTQSTQTCETIAKALKPYFNDENLFVFSTDLSHYPNYTNAQITDKKITDAVLKNSPEKFLQSIKEIELMNIPNLQTAMCGWTSVLTLLDITKDVAGINYTMIDSKNSGDSPFGDKSQVVGYTAMAVELNNSLEKSTMNDFLTPSEKQNLLKIARQTIREYVTNGKVPKVDDKILSHGLLKTSGAFVTLTENGKLRGCIGNFTTTGSLYQTIQEMAVAASTNDHRFSPVTADEIDIIDIEISVLTPMQKINSVDEIKLGRDGIYIKKGINGGTFLPQVATETGWTLEEFLGHCARDKAGIGWDGWKDADIYIYQAIVFGEKDN